MYNSQLIENTAKFIQFYSSDSQIIYSINFHSNGVPFFKFLVTFFPKI